MKVVTFMRPDDKTSPPPWADLVLRLNVNNIHEALPSVFGYSDDVVFLRNDVKVSNKDVVMRFFSSFKSSAVIEYNGQEIGYFLSSRDKNMDSRLVITHYALKV